MASGNQHNHHHHHSPFQNMHFHPSTELDIPRLLDKKDLTAEPQPAVYIVPPPHIKQAQDDTQSSDIVDRLSELQQQMYLDNGLTPPERPAPGFAEIAGLSETAIISALGGVDDVSQGSGSTFAPRWRKLDDLPATADSYYVPNFLSPESVADTILRQMLINEVSWSTMSHRGGNVPRLVCVQADITPDGWYPIYRHPVDSPIPTTHNFSASVRLLKLALESALGESFNHVLIQQYRSGDDAISEHADKTIDLVPGSKIVNISLGALRHMTFKRKREKPIRKLNLVRAHVTNYESFFRVDPTPSSSSDEEEQLELSKSNTATNKSTSTKPQRANQLISLEHNSLLVVGSHTNSLWTHQIKPDRRPLSKKTDAEKAFDGTRISLTFRSVATFANNSNSNSPKLIYGGGASSHDRNAPATVLDPNSEDVQIRESARAQAKKLLTSFAAENRLGEKFDWQKAYGRGFDICEFPPDV